MRILNRGTALTIGRTSASPTTTLATGQTIVDDAHWAEIVVRYRVGLTPHLTSGRLVALPDEDRPRRDAHDPPSTPLEAPGPVSLPAPEPSLPPAPAPPPEPEPASESAQKKRRSSRKRSK